MRHLASRCCFLCVDSVEDVYYCILLFPYLLLFTSGCLFVLDFGFVLIFGGGGGLNLTKGYRRNSAFWNGPLTYITGGDKSSDICLNSGPVKLCGNSIYRLLSGRQCFITGGRYFLGTISWQNVFPLEIFGLLCLNFGLWAQQKHNSYKAISVVLD